MRLRHPAKPNSGVALILVLMLVVLMTIMILAFFLSVQTETKSVHSVVAGQNSRELADIAVQSVISQIQQATTQPQGTTIAWASQPGMIRTYNNSGTALGWYKLYSAPLTNMVVTNPSESLNSVQQDLPTGGWATASSANYGVYTDINSPVYSAIPPARLRLPRPPTPSSATILPRPAHPATRPLRPTAPSTTRPRCRCDGSTSCKMARWPPPSPA
jgi:Tfp pilus assembly protein PilX